jgi:NAD(P)-dependent dehydrogenase (short-subunit alcohol dehydrogenase family)
MTINTGYKPPLLTDKRSGETKNKIRFNAVTPGVVDTPLHKEATKDSLKTCNRMGTISDPNDIAKAVVYLTEATHVTGEMPHVDDGAHVGRW